MTDETTEEVTPETTTEESPAVLPTEEVVAE